MTQLDLFHSKAVDVPRKSVPTYLSAAIGYSLDGEYDTARGRYYRYYWQLKGDRSPKHAHIRGSAVGTVLGDYRRSLVDEAIARGQKPAEIVALIRRFPPEYPELPLS